MCRLFKEIICKKNRPSYRDNLDRIIKVSRPIPTTSTSFIYRFVMPSCITYRNSFLISNTCVCASVPCTEFCKSHFVSFHSILFVMLLISSPHYAPASSASWATAAGPLFLLCISHLFLFQLSTNHRESLCVGNTCV